VVRSRLIGDGFSQRSVAKLIPNKAGILTTAAALDIPGRGIAADTISSREKSCANHPSGISVNAGV
jgi:hypothetical protein